MNVYVISVISAVVVLLISALIANLIKFEGGSNPKDPKKRKVFFWIIAILAPVLTYVLGAFVIYPDPNMDLSAYEDHMNLLPIGSIISLVIYILLGFAISKISRNGKLSNWF